MMKSKRAGAAPVHGEPIAGLPPDISIHRVGKPATPYGVAINAALQVALSNEPTLPEAVLDIRGMSGRRYRRLINHLVSLVDDAAYLEIGCWKGSTLCSAIYGNRVRAMGIDNWSQFGGPSGDFLRNLSEFKTEHARVSILEEDFRAVPYEHIGKFNIFMFDGPHSREDHIDGIVMPFAALQSPFILIVDDFNRPQVRKGTADALNQLGLDISSGVIVRTKLDGQKPVDTYEKSDWLNGYLIAAPVPRAAGAPLLDLFETVQDVA